MQKILVITKQTTNGGGLKSSLEFTNALKMSVNNKVQLFTEKNACENKFTYLKISIFNGINKYIKVFFKNKNREITNTIPQVFKFFNHKKYSHNIILIHYIYEFLSLRDVILFKKPTLIFINDMWFLGGIKHFFPNSLLKKPKINIINFFQIINYICWLFKKKYLSKKKEIVFIASSDWLKKKALKSDMLKNHNIEKINTPVNTKFWKKINKKEARFKLNLPANKKLILFVAKGGLKNHRKGGDIFLKIINFYKHESNLNFMILGQKKENIHEGVFFYDFHSNEKKLRDLYNSADLVICLSRYENIPYSTLESMSCGVPNISFDVGGIKEAIRHKENGIILKNFSEESLKNSISWCLNKNNYYNLSKNSIKHIQKEFSYEKILKDYNKIQKQI